MSKNSLAVGAPVLFSIGGKDVYLPPLSLSQLYTALSVYRQQKRREAVESVKDFYTPVQMSEFIRETDKYLEAVDVSTDEFINSIFNRSDGLARILHMAIQSTDQRDLFTVQDLIEFILDSPDDEAFGTSLEAWYKASGLGGDEGKKGEASDGSGEPS